MVLDTTALLAYARLRGMAVAEAVAMIEEEGGASLVGIPSACFLAAFADLAEDEQQRLVDLATRVDGVTVLLPLTGTETIEVARLGPVMGHAVIEARARDAYLATYDGAQARKHLPERRIYDLVDD
ncbi:hypothetical protein F4553_002047 [Allocatelliglobosispora scoriae]|uniref:PIN domain-containing protein n=1 Tax=Allocatelliglobosispora scoriae TaxID=643052 RepID=A0A841BMR6_9ACTN|nr:hypothetical protein [Allocatelliglobosispora scoriae]MBB5868668.1 hypothetical protein [Allocatelliglobosispora scoriae]